MLISELTKRVKINFSVRSIFKLYLVQRVGALNRKGVLDRQRQPKPAAYKLKERYEALDHSKNNNVLVH